MVRSFAYGFCLGAWGIPSGLVIGSVLTRCAWVRGGFWSLFSLLFWYGFDTLMPMPIPTASSVFDFFSFSIAGQGIIRKGEKRRNTELKLELSAAEKAKRGKGNGMGSDWLVGRWGRGACLQQISRVGDSDDGTPARFLFFFFFPFVSHGSLDIWYLFFLRQANEKRDEE